MNLAEKFKFTTSCSETIYKASFSYLTGMYAVIWKEHGTKMHMNYLISAAQNHVSDGDWKLVEDLSSSKLIKTTNKLNTLIIEKLDAGLYDQDGPVKGVELTGDEHEYLECTMQLIETLLDVAEIS